MIKPDDIKIAEFKRSEKRPEIPSGCTLVEASIMFNKSVLVDRFARAEMVDLVKHEKDILRRRIWRDIYPEIELRKLAYDWVNDYYKTDEHGFPRSLINPSFRDRVTAIGNFLNYPL